MAFSTCMATLGCFLFLLIRSETDVDGVERASRDGMRWARATPADKAIQRRRKRKPAWGLGRMMRAKVWTAERQSTMGKKDGCGENERVAKTKMVGRKIQLGWVMKMILRRSTGMMVECCGCNWS